ncbi:MAG: Fic family protein [Pirellulaceae bacterium]
MPSTVDGILELNRFVLDGLPSDDGVAPGKIRTFEVGVAGYRGAPSEDCEHLLLQLCNLMNRLRPPADDMRIAFGIIRAIASHVYMAMIHPFGDGNGRTARLVELQALLGCGVPMVAAHLLSNHYNMTRSEYYRQLSKASKTQEGVWPFIEYAVRGLVDGLDAQIETIRKHQRNVAWRDHVYQQFRDKRSPADHRRRRVALKLGEEKKAVSVKDICNLSADISRDYAGKTTKTLTRDMNALADQQLIVRVEGGKVRANLHQLNAFFPRRRRTAK